MLWFIVWFVFWFALLLCIVVIVFGCWCWDLDVDSFEFDAVVVWFVCLISGLVVWFELIAGVEIRLLLGWRGCLGGLLCGFGFVVWWIYLWCFCFACLIWLFICWLCCLWFVCWVDVSCCLCVCITVMYWFCDLIRFGGSWLLVGCLFVLVWLCFCLCWYWWFTWVLWIWFCLLVIMLVNSVVDSFVLVFDFVFCWF